MSFIPSSRVIQERAGTTTLAADLAAINAAVAGKLASNGNGSGLTGLTISQIADLASQLSALSSAISGKANEAHSHGLSDITGLVDALNNLGAEIDALETGKADTAHDQTAATISDSTAVGRSVLTAVNAPAGRSALGLVIGTDVLAPDGDASGLQNIPASNNLPPLLPFARVATLMGSALTLVGVQPSVVLIPNRLACWLSQPVPAFTSLTLQITVLTAQAGGKVRVGMYHRASDCGPGTLIGDGELDASSTGNKSITIACANTVTGIKWLAINANASISVRGLSIQSSLGRLSGGYAWYDTIYRASTYGAHPADETAQATYTPLEATFPEIMWRGV